jgi:hypothetical protein
LDSAIDNGIGNGHLVIRGKSGDECSRSRRLYPWCIAGEDHDDIIVGELKGSEYAAERTLSRMPIRNGTIDPRQRRQCDDVSPYGDDFGCTRFVERCCNQRGQGKTANF